MRESVWAAHPRYGYPINEALRDMHSWLNADHRPTSYDPSRLTGCPVIGIIDAGLALTISIDVDVNVNHQVSRVLPIRGRLCHYEGIRHLLEEPMATDWAALRIEYINTPVTMQELADKNGLKLSTVTVRASREKWGEERSKSWQNVAEAANADLASRRAEELAKFNEEDLALAKKIREKASLMMEEANTPQDLKALSGAVDTAQKVGRLALGANTESSIVTTKELPASVEDFI